MSKSSRMRQRATIAIVSLSLLAFSAFAYTRHVVKRGETLYGIAYNYHVSPEDIVKHNPQAAKGLKKGMEILIPDGSEPVPDSAQQPSEQTTDQQIAQQADNASKDEAALQKAADSKASLQNAEDSNASLQNAEEAQQIDVLPKAAEQKEDEHQSGVLHWASNVYRTRGQESFAGISAKTGVSEDLLIEFNPFLDPYKVMPGTLVRLTDDAPFDDTTSLEAEPQPEVEPEPLPEENPIAFEISETEIDNEQADEETPVLQQENTNILLLLPFMSDSPNATRAAQQYADFYRGFLIAANELCIDDDNTEVEIIALDTHSDMDKLRDQLQFTKNRDLAVVIAPDEEMQMREIIDSITPQGIYVFNIFDFKSEEYKTNPYIVQANIHQELMYDKAIEGLQADYPDYTPVILTALEAKDEKTPFVNYLKQRYSEQGLDVIDLEFEGSLSLANLDSIANSDAKYVFIPRSGAQAVFNRFAPALRQLFKTSSPETRFGLFGYPDWIAYRGESLETLQELGAEIYSRFASNEKNMDTRRFQDQYEHWYGRNMIESVPYQSLLGYDTAKYLIGALQNGNIQSQLDSQYGYKGLQSAFRFIKPEAESGYVNDTLFILKFVPGQNFIAKVL